MTPMIRSILVAAVAAGPVAALAQTEPAPASLQADAEEFYLYTLPLMEVMRRRDAFLKTHPANGFVHARTLADETAREVTTPNNDTIYSNAFVDLRGGPVTIAVPETGKRYFSLALMDAWSNNFAYFGQRATGGKALMVTLVGPDAAAPAGAAHVVRSPTPWVWALGRTLVSGPDDLPAARAVQDRLVISGGVAGPVPTPVPPRSAPAPELQAAALRLMAENRPLPADAPEIARFRRAGLDQPIAGGPRAAALEAGFAAARRATETAKRDGQVVNGWSYPKRNLGEFGTDYRYRAQVAVGGLAALGRAEAMYLRAVAPTPLGLYDGTKHYRIHFAKSGEPPVGSFWSLTMYERTADGRFFLVANPIKRYSIGDRTQGLTRNPDGSLDIWIGHDDPGAAKRANWLPAPAAPFMMSLRTYLPKPELVEERWRAPAVEEVAP